MGEAAAQAGFRCPSCRGALREDGEILTCGRGHRYHRFDGVPLLVPGIEAASVDLRRTGGALPRIDSTRMGIAPVDAALARGDRILELGAGIEAAENPQIVRTDRFLYASGVLDVIADAHALPFADASFDFVFSFAVFEHLEAPWIAAREIARVLRPGGRVYTLTAFMQRLHGYPSHYFNMTESGLRRIFADGFEVESAGPSTHCPHAETNNLLHVMGDMLDRLQESGPERSTRDRLRAAQLRVALRVVARRYPQLAPAMIAAPGGHDAWARIAPAVELTALRV